MRDVSPQSPEARRKRLATMRAAFGTEVEEKLKPRVTAWEVTKRVAIGVYNDGFIHAGNLAYLSIVALFPFFIVAAAVAHLLGQGQDAMLTVTNVLRRLPPDVASTLREPVQEVLTAGPTEPGRWQALRARAHRSTRQGERSSKSSASETPARADGARVGDANYTGRRRSIGISAASSASMIHPNSGHGLTSFPGFRKSAASNRGARTA